MGTCCIAQGAQLYDELDGCDVGKAQDGRDICIHVADSLHCTAETNTIL